MSVPGAVPLKVFSPRCNDDETNLNSEMPLSWTLPCWVMGSVSITVSQMLGQGVWISQRLANELGIHDGDVVKFECVLSNSVKTRSFQHKVSIIQNELVSNCDVVVHGGIHLGIFESESMGAYSSELTFSNGDYVETNFQDMWAGMRIVEYFGEGTLYFSGEISNGDASYGFYLESNGKELIRGYGYYANKDGKYTKEEMAYKALLDGLTWATRVPVKKLEIKGDSEKVIRMSQSSIPSPGMKNAEVSECLRQIRLCRRNIIKVTWKVIPPNENELAIKQAQLAVEQKTHETTCHWTNLNDHSGGQADVEEKDDNLSSRCNEAMVFVGLLVMLALIFCIYDLNQEDIPVQNTPGLEEGEL